MNGNQKIISSILEEEIKAILIEGIYDANLREIETYHRIGEALIKAEKDGLKLHPDIPEHIKKYSVLFYQKYPCNTEELANELPLGKLISWRKLKALL
jgi:hypothetical protein